MMDLGWQSSANSKLEQVLHGILFHFYLYYVFVEWCVQCSENWHILSSLLSLCRQEGNILS